MASLALFALIYAVTTSAQDPTATAPLIINQGPTYRCYSWYAELSDAGGYPSDEEWDCPYDDHVGRFTLGTDAWKDYPKYYETDPGFNGSVNGAQGSPLTVALHNNAKGVDCSNRELAFTYDFPTQALFANVSTLDLSKWDQVIIEFDLNVISATSSKADCTCLSNDTPDYPQNAKAHFTTDILYWFGEEQHDSGDYNVISVRHLDPYITQNYGFWTWTNSNPGEDHYGHRVQFSDHQASPGQKSHVKLDLKYLISKYSSQLCQGGDMSKPIHLNSIQFVLINTGTETTLEISNVKANALNYAPGSYTSTPVTPGCTPTNCPTQPADPAYSCGTDAGQGPTSVPSTPCATPQTMYGQCGGSGWTGPTCCPGGSSCQTQNDYYAQCIAPATSGSSDGGGLSITSAPSTTTPTPPTTSFGQCGGIGWTGPTNCPGGTTCQKQNDYYYQCLS